MSDCINYGIGNLDIFMLGMSLLGILAAGIWVRVRRRRKRLHPQVELTVTARLLGPQRSNNVVETTLTFRNTGKVRVELPKIELEIRGMEADSDLFALKNKSAQFDFTTRIAHEPNLVPPQWDYLFVEPGGTQEIRRISKVDARYSFLLVRSEFESMNGDRHSSACVIESHASQPAMTAS
jgi:hypothetical protein